MRRLLSETRHYLARLVHAVRGGWDAFFFTPADPTALGLIRVATGLLAMWSLLVFGLDLHDYFGSDGWAEPSAIQMGQRAPAWSFWFLVPDGALRLAWIGCLTVLAMNIVGLFSRWTAVLAWVIVVSTVRRVPIALFGFDQVISPLTLYLAVTGASGQAVSLDRFLRRWRQSRSSAAAGPLPPRAVARASPGRQVTPDEPGVPVPTISANLSLRLIQLHLVVIYAMAAMGKLQGPSWWDGTATWKTMTAGEFVVGDFTPMADWPLVINLLTHASLGPGIALSDPDLDRHRPPDGTGLCGGDARGDRPDEPGPDRIHAGHADGEPGVRLRVLAAPAGDGPGPARAAGALRWGLPAVPGLDRDGHRGGSRRRHRADRPDRGRRAIDPSRIDDGGLHAVDARRLRLRAGHGRVRRCAVDLGIPAAVLAVRGVRSPAGDRIDRPACIQ